MSPGKTSVILRQEGGVECHTFLSRSSPAGKVAQLRVESVNGAEGSKSIAHVPVGRDVVASQGCLSNLRDIPNTLSEEVKGRRLMIKRPAQMNVAHALLFMDEIGFRVG